MGKPLDERDRIDGKTSCWHQPEDLVCFDYKVTAESSDWQAAKQDEKDDHFEPH
jgi:hypothetical protein